MPWYGWLITVVVVVWLLSFSGAVYLIYKEWIR